MEDRRQGRFFCLRCGSSNVTFRQRQGSWLCLSCDEEFATVASAMPHTPPAVPCGQFTMPYTPPVSQYTPPIQPMPAAEKSTARPIRVFISFGRPDRDICRRICQELKERGFDPWFDEERLNPAVDWREKIAEGMRDCDAAVICFSRYSVEESYVCNGELQLALQYLEGNILAVKMEQDAQLPVQLRKLRRSQWLDISDYKTRQIQEAKTPYVFDCWFKAQMDELCQMLNSGEGREAAQELKLIRERLGVRVNSGKQDNLLENGMVGREWMFDRVDQWLRNPAGKPLCVLYGDPGVGKSAFAAHYLRDKEEKALTGVFCESALAYESSPEMTLKNLAYLLSRKLPDYRTALASQIQAESQLDRLTAPDLFHRLLADPLRTMTIPENAGTQCLIIDGLDECARKEPERRLEFVRTLAEGAARLPTWIRILALSQEIPDFRGVLSGAQVLRLEGMSTENQADVRQYFEKQLGAKFREYPVWETALNALMERSSGMFQYARLVSRNILEGQILIEDPDGFPHGLAVALDRWFRVYFPNEREYKEQCKNNLNPLPLYRTNLRYSS